MADANKPFPGPQSHVEPPKPIAGQPPPTVAPEPDLPQSTYEVVGRGRVIMTSVGRFVEGEVCLLDDAEASAFGKEFLKKIGTAHDFEKLRHEHPPVRKE